MMPPLWPAAAAAPVRGETVYRWWFERSGRRSKITPRRREASSAPGSGLSACPGWRVLPGWSARGGRRRAWPCSRRRQPRCTGA